MSAIGLILLIAATILVAGGYAWLSVRHSRGAQSYLFRCPNCGQKLRYAARRAGQAGACPRCRERVTFPAIPRTATLDSQSEAAAYRLTRRETAGAAKKS
jgi:hypothetical protein